MDDKVPQGTAPEYVDRELTVDRLVTGDRPSILFFGMVGAHAIRKDAAAVFMVDVLGRVHLMPPSSVKVLHKPKVSDEDLNGFTEESAIQILVRQGDSEDEILQYLARRKPLTEGE